MEGPHIDLGYLERFCKGDRSRMEKYIRMYLDMAPVTFVQLTEKLNAGDAEGLAVLAHSLRPQATYMGAQGILGMLTAIEHRARVEGAAACADLVTALILLCGQVNAELRAVLAGRTS